MWVRRAAQLSTVSFAQSSSNDRQVARATYHVHGGDCMPVDTRGACQRLLRRHNSFLNQRSTMIVVIRSADDNLGQPGQRASQVDRHLPRIWMQTLLLLAAFFEQTEVRLCGQVGNACSGERQVKQNPVKVIPTKPSDAITCQDLVLLVQHADYRSVESATTQVVHNDMFAAG